MRLAFAASALCLSLGLSVLRSDSRRPATPAAATAPATTAASKPRGAWPRSDAAAKHMKRTACLKDAKTKKLIGADKTAFLKSCIEAPPPISASRQIPPIVPRAALPRGRGSDGQRRCPRCALLNCRKNGRVPGKSNWTILCGELQPC